MVLSWKKKFPSLWSSMLPRTCSIRACGFSPPPNPVFAAVYNTACVCVWNGLVRQGIFTAVSCCNINIIKFTFWGLIAGLNMLHKLQVACKWTQSPVNIMHHTFCTLLLTAIVLWYALPTWWMSFQETASFLEQLVPLTNRLTRRSSFSMHPPKFLRTVTSDFDFAYHKTHCNFSCGDAMTEWLPLWYMSRCGAAISLELISLKLGQVLRYTGVPRRYCRFNSRSPQ
jgi:hypothetical protein